MNSHRRLLSRRAISVSQVNFTFVMLTLRYEVKRLYPNLDDHIKEKMRINYSVPLLLRDALRDHENTA